MAFSGEIELYYDGATRVLHVDPDGVIPGEATCDLYAPDGSLICEGSVDVPNVSTTVEAAVDAGVLQVASADGFAAGDVVAVTASGRTFLATVDHIDQDTLLLEPSLPLTPAVGSTVALAQLSASIPAPGIAYIGKACRLVWRYPFGAGERQIGRSAVVVRWPWTPVVTAQLVAERYNIMFGEIPDGTEAERVAKAANELIRTAIILTGRRPELLISSDVFASVAQSAVAYQLAMDGKALGGDIFGAQRELRFQFEDGMTRVIASGTAAYDGNADGKLSTEEVRRQPFTIRVTR